MSQFFNVSSEKEKRRLLRKNQTYAETILWSILRNKQLDGYKFHRQYSVDRYVLDFYCPALKLAIEVDGKFHLQPEAIKYDAAREAFIAGFGISFLRFTNIEILENLDNVLQRIVAWISGQPSPSLRRRG